jgi:pSer/pThr/pTyr-binding forkhead associated (FHA) protein
MASIIIISEKDKGEFLPLGRRTSVIGRNEALSLQILDDLVSRKHLRIYFNKATGTYYAEDMKSKHGVFVNQHRITEDTALSEGNEILIGKTTLLFTDADFDDRESALSHYKKRGERVRKTRAD